MLPTALLSVSDKTGIAVFARRLAAKGWRLLSTGGTARALREAGVEVVDVATFTGAAEQMDGRVKTLHPRIHAGILGDREAHAEEAATHGVEWIDLVVVNLYPFEAITQRGADFDQAIEHVDIGGPTLLRAAAKNQRHVTVVVDPADYALVADLLDQGAVDDTTRRQLAVKAFRHTSRYDAVVADWFASRTPGPAFPDEITFGLTKIQDVRYGENPHQAAAFYADGERTGRSLARVVQHQGGELSYNNLGDLDGALRAVFEYEAPACVVVKHANPCGAAVADTVEAAFVEALAGDPTSAYGGIVALNRPCDEACATAIKRARILFHVLAAPGFSPNALEKLSTRDNLRVIDLPTDWAKGRPPGRDAKRVQGGFLVQDWDLGALPAWRTVTKRAPTPGEDAAMRFAWSSVRSVKSNAIVLATARQGGTLALNGVGAGQMSRVDAVRLAISKATRPVPGNVLASDAFLPFADGLEVAAAAGVTAVVQPGGSIRDGDVIAAADHAGIAMVFTDVRHFRH
jgi:phosphoribosylaminoimidazolecarboxamide formyltransferase/IMP cyclohydrolase